MRQLVLVVLVPFVVWFAWPSREAEDTRVPIGHGLVVGKAVRAGNLAVWPVFAEDVPEIGAFRSLEQAQARGELAIHECEQEEVGALRIENRGDVPILACAGAIFAGGKQDRQLGEDTVIAAHSTVTVKTFCVERNRWGGGREFVVINAKAQPAVRAAAQYDSDQSEVWRGVAASRASLGLADGSYRAVANAPPKRATKVLAHLRAQEGDLVGYAYAIHGKVMGMRTFAHPALLEPRLDAMVHAVCVEAELRQPGARRPAPAPRDTEQALRRVLVTEPPRGTAPEEDLRRMKVFLQMASDAYDRGEYDLAVAQAGKVLALDPQCESAKTLIRIAEETRVSADGDIRERFNDEWRSIMERMENDALPHPEMLRYPNAGPGVNAGGAALAPSGGLFFNDGTDGDARGLAGFIALVQDVDEAAEKTVETNGVNRNSYGKTPKGNHATCAIRGKDGRWIPLTRDWTAR